MSLPDDPSRPTPDPPVQPVTSWDEGILDEEPQSLVRLVNHVLDRGVVVQGDVTLSVAGVDLVYLGLNALLTSISTARRTLDRPVPAGLPSAAGPRPSAPPSARSSGAAVATLQSSSGAPFEDVAREADSPPVEEVSERVSAALATQLTEAANALPTRLDVDPDGVQRDLGRLVLTIVELLRQVVEHQAVRRMEDDDLSEEQVERMGVALQRLEEKMREIKAVFGLADEELNIDLGPLGKLL